LYQQKTRGRTELKFSEIENMIFFLFTFWTTQLRRPATSLKPVDGALFT
jgi:hypothetical protein